MSHHKPYQLDSAVLPSAPSQSTSSSRRVHWKWKRRVPGCNQDDASRSGVRGRKVSEVQTIDAHHGKGKHHVLRDYSELSLLDWRQTMLSRTSSTRVLITESLRALMFNPSTFQDRIEILFIVNYDVQWSQEPQTAIGDARQDCSVLPEFAARNASSVFQ